MPAGSLRTPITRAQRSSTSLRHQPPGPGTSLGAEPRDEAGSHLAQHSSSGMQSWLDPRPVTPPSCESALTDPHPAPGRRAESSAGGVCGPGSRPQRGGWVGAAGQAGRAVFSGAALLPGGRDGQGGAGPGGGVSGGVCRPLRGPDPVVDPAHVVGHTGVDAGLVEPPTAVAPADDAVQVGHAVLLADQGAARVPLRQSCLSEPRPAPRHPGKSPPTPWPHPRCVTWED